MKKFLTLCFSCLLAVFAYADSYTIYTGVPDSNGYLMYSPNQITVEVGDTVVFQYYSSSVHTTFSGAAFPSFITDASNPSHQIIMSSTGYYWFYDANQSPNTGGGINVRHSSNCSADIQQSTTDPHYLTWDFQGIASGQAPFTYTWDFGDGNQSTLQNPTHTYAQSGVYGVCLNITDSAGCVQYHCDTVFAGNKWCNAGFGTQVNGLQVQFNDYAFHSGNAYYSYSFGDGTGSAQANPSHTYSSPGVYTVCQTIIDSLNGCSDTVCTTVTVGNTTNCFVSFQYHPDSANPTGMYPVHFYSSATGVAPYSYHWDFGDGNTSAQANPTHHYAQAGTYLACVSITDANGCSSTYCDSVIVGRVQQACLADFTYATYLLSVTFTDQSSFSSSAVNYHWDFGDGNSSAQASPNHNYAQAGTYLVCLTITDNAGCSSQKCAWLTVQHQNSPCDASFAAYPDTSHNQMMSYYFGSTAQNSPSASYHWDFGDGNTGSGSFTQHTYNHPGFYKVCLTVTDSTPNGAICTQTSCDTILADTVFFTMVPSFRYVVDPSGYQVSFTNQTYEWNFNRSTALNYHWDFGDGNTSNLEHPTHAYANHGTYKTCLTITDPSSGYSRSHCDESVAAFAMSIEEENKASLKVYPLPVVDILQLSLNYPQSAKATLELYSMQGSLVFRKEIELQTGDKQFELNLSELNNGMYQLVIRTDASEILRHSILKQQ